MGSWRVGHDLVTDHVHTPSQRGESPFCKDQAAPWASDGNCPTPAGLGAPSYWSWVHALVWMPHPTSVQPGSGHLCFIPGTFFSALSETPVKANLPLAESQGITRQVWWTRCCPQLLPSVFSPPSLSPSCLSPWIGQPLFLLVFPGNTVTLLFSPVVSSSHFQSPSLLFPLLTSPLSFLLCLFLVPVLRCLFELIIFLIMMNNNWGSWPKIIINFASLLVSSLHSKAHSAAPNNYHSNRLTCVFSIHLLHANFKYKYK